MDGRHITERTHDSEHRVTTSVYTLTIVMNEENPSMSDHEAKIRLADEFQAALDAGHFVRCRYDALDFNVSERVIVTTKEAGD